MGAEGVGSVGGVGRVWDQLVVIGDGQLEGNGFSELRRPND